MKGVFDGEVILYRVGIDGDMGEAGQGLCGLFLISCGDPVGCLVGDISLATGCAGIAGEHCQWKSLILGIPDDIST